jgi:membrane-associated protease RseP (regulator of RpoE activity)
MNRRLLSYVFAAPLLLGPLGVLAQAQPGRTFTPPPPPPPPPPRFDPPRFEPPRFEPPSPPPFSPTSPQAVTERIRIQEQMRQEQRSMDRMTRPGNVVNPPPHGGGVGGRPAANAPRVPVVAVKGIVANSQAARLGLQRGDVIVSYGGAAVASVQDFTTMRGAEAADGPAREIVVRRGNDELTFPLAPGMFGVYLETR